MAATACLIADEMDVMEDDFQAVVDSNEEVDQLAGFAHTYEVWADDVTTGTNLFIAEVVSNVVSLYSSAAITKNLGTTGNRWSNLYGVNADLSGTLTLGPITATHVLYAGVGGLVSGSAGFTWTNATSKLTLGTNAIYSQGAHGQTLAADDWAVGSASTNYALWDNSASLFVIVGTGTTNFRVSGTSSKMSLQVSGLQTAQIASTDSNGRPVLYFGPTGDNDEFKIINNGTWQIWTTTSSSLILGTNSTAAITIGTSQQTTIAQWANLGTTTLATAQGDLAAGLTGAAQTWYDQSAATHYWYNASGTASVHIATAANTPIMKFTLSNSARTATIGETTADLFTIQSVAANFVLDSFTSGKPMSFKSGGGAINTCFDYLLNNNCTGTGAVVSLWRITGTHAQTSGTSILTGLEFTPTINQTGTASGNYEILRLTLTETAFLGTTGYYARFTKGGTVGFAVTSAGGLAVGNVATAAGAGVAIVRTSATFGADAAPTAGFVGDCVGDLRVSSGLNVGGTTAPATGNLIVTANAMFGSTTDGTAGYGFTAALKTQWVSVGDTSVSVHEITCETGSEVAFNLTASDIDFRVAGGSLAYALFLDASTATENLALLTTAAPNWQSMDRGIFLGDCTTAPTGDPTAGGYLYSEAGALKWRGSSGNVTEIAPA